MTGLSTLLFTLAIILVMALVYGTGMTGWIAGCFLLLGGWTAILIMKAADPGTLIVQGLNACVMLGLSLRWIFIHSHWTKRITKDRRETDEKQQQVRGVVDDLKARIAI